MTVSDPVGMLPLQFAEFAIRHKGGPLHMERRPWLPPIYNLPVMRRSDGSYRRKILLNFGRQSEKSSTLGNKLISYSNLIPYLRSLYISASIDQMREFSDERLKAIIEGSPYLVSMTKTETGKQATQNVLTKRWSNGSKITLRGVYKNADRVRGISSDFLEVDEIQDVLQEHMPVIEETQYASELEGGAVRIYAGTPKTFDNTIEFYWDQLSTQFEWAVLCESCKRYNVIEIDNIGPEGLICTAVRPDGRKCGHALDPLRNGSWQRTGRADAPYAGFRLPQPVSIYTAAHRPKWFAQRWKDLIEKKEAYPLGKFLNEVMARSFDMGAKPVTRAQVMACCEPDLHMVEKPTRAMQKMQTFAALDWGTGEVSYTVLSIWGYDSKNRFRLFYAKKYTGAEANPIEALEDIKYRLRIWQPTLVGSDYGFGFDANARLERLWGARLHRIMHSASSSKKVRWDKDAHRWVTHRSRVMEDAFTLIRRGPHRGGVVFPRWEEMEPFAKDILGIYSDYSERRREVVFDHPPNKPDDFFQTFVYALLVSQQVVPRHDLQAPIAAAGTRFDVD
jgi:hypothetical protein